MTYPGVDPASDPDRAAVEQRRKEQEEEFNAYRAVQDIPWGSVTAFYTGEVVPKSTVEARGWLDLDLVERIAAAPAETLPTPVPAPQTTSTKSSKSGSDS